MEMEYENENFLSLCSLLLSEFHFHHDYDYIATTLKCINVHLERTNMEEEVDLSRNRGKWLYTFHNILPIRFQFHSYKIPHSTSSFSSTFTTMMISILKLHFLPCFLVSLDCSFKRGIAPAAASNVSVTRTRRDYKFERSFSSSSFEFRQDEKSPVWNKKILLPVLFAEESDGKNERVASLLPPPHLTLV